MCTPLLQHWPLCHRPTHIHGSLANLCRRPPTRPPTRPPAHPTARPPRVVIATGRVVLEVNVADANHRRALFNMMLTLLIIGLLLLFVTVLNVTIYKVGAGGRRSSPASIAASPWPHTPVPG